MKAWALTLSMVTLDLTQVFGSQGLMPILKQSALSLTDWVKLQQANTFFLKVDGMTSEVKGKVSIMKRKAGDLITQKYVRVDT
jgi:hypothetical protein